MYCSYFAAHTAAAENTIVWIRECIFTGSCKTHEKKTENKRVGWQDAEP